QFFKFNYRFKDKRKDLIFGYNFREGHPSKSGKILIKRWTLTGSCKYPKDVYYKFLNHKRFNLYRFVHLLAIKDY
ncbi:MAG: hypothetical protein ACFFDN_36670, partial [Candidatus Hodarchaeota archaeon]